MTTFLIKYVPDAEPNVDGEWMSQELNDAQVHQIPKGLGPRFEFFTQFVPPAHHVVMVTRGRL